MDQAGSVLNLGDVPGLCGCHQTAACIWAFGTGDLEKGGKGGCQEELLAEQGSDLAFPLENKFNLEGSPRSTILGLGGSWL